MKMRLNVIAFPRLNFGFIAIEKCASTAAKTVIAQSLMPHHDHVSAGTVDEIPDWDDLAIRAAIVRDPLDRLRSCYESKIRPDAVLLRENSLGAFWPGMQFWQFVEAACALPDDALDRHLHPQTARLGVPLRVNALLEFDRLERDWPALAAVVPGLARELPVMNESCGVARHDDLTARLTRARYCADFAALGYGMADAA